MSDAPNLPNIPNLSSADIQVRLAAVEALRQSNPEEAVPLLQSMLHDGSADVRLSAVKVLGEVGVDLASHRLSSLQITAMDTRLMTCLFPLIRMLSDEVESIQIAARSALLEIGSAAGNPVLTEILQDRDSRYREEAARELGVLRDAGSVPALIQALKDPVWTVRLNAAKALQEIRDELAVPALVDLIVDDEWRVREAAVYAVAHIGGIHAAPGLIRALMDPVQSIHLVAAAFLSTTNDPAMLPELVRLMTHPTAYIRNAAANLLYEFGGSDSMARRLIADSRFGALQCVNIIDKLRSVRYRNAMSTLAYKLPETRSFCETVLFTGEPEERVGAQEILNWLEGRNLVRASEKNPDAGNSELLHSVDGVNWIEDPETLLRANNGSDMAEMSSRKRRSLRDRLFGK